MDEMLKDLNGPWSNAACMGYCLIAMRRAGLRPTAQRRVLLALGRGVRRCECGEGREDRICQ